MMNTIVVSTDPTLLDVELPRTLLESSSVSTFLPEEEASICPLLSNINDRIASPLTFSHPLTPSANDTGIIKNVDIEAKIETRSSSGSSSGIGMDVTDATSKSLFSKHNYQHLQLNNGIQDANNHITGKHLAKKTPIFVSWNWPIIRKSTLVLFLSGLFAMCVLVVALIIRLPKTCNPKTAWYRGSVFYEIFPANFQDSNNDGIGDLRGIVTRIDYLKSLNIAAVRLNSIFELTKYAEDNDKVVNLFKIADELGTKADLQYLLESLHSQNISLILDLPLNYVNELKQNNMSNSEIHSIIDSITQRVTVGENLITKAILYWEQMGVDGFYLKGLEKFLNHKDFMSNLREWNRVLGSNKPIIINEIVLKGMSEMKILDILEVVSLLDVYLDYNSDAQTLYTYIKEKIYQQYSLTEDGAWIHWSLRSTANQTTAIKKNVKLTLAAIILELMLPGTTNVLSGNEIAISDSFDKLALMQWNHPNNLTNIETLSWWPNSHKGSIHNKKIIAAMIELRDKSPSLYKRVIYKPEAILSNTQIRYDHENIIVIERVYPRRNSFISVTNFGDKHVKLDMTTLYYSGLTVISAGKKSNKKVYFKEFEIGPYETIVIKLDK